MKRMLRITFHAVLALFVGILLARPCPAQQLKEGTDFAFKDCYANLSTTQLSVGNAHLHRTWRIDHGRLFATSFVDLDTKMEWIDLPTALPSPTPPSQAAPDRGTFRGGSGVFGPTQAESLRLELEETTSDGTVQYEFQLFPDASGIRMWLNQKSDKPMPAHELKLNQQPANDALEHLLLTKPNLRLTQVTMLDRTDEHNELVFENSWLLHSNEAALKLRGNLFIIEDTMTGDGLIFLKEAPQPEMRPIENPIDAWISGSPMGVHSRYTKPSRSHFDLSFYGNGFSGSGQGYPFALLAFHGGQPGRVATLQKYQRQIRQYAPERDGQLLSNTWGDRSGGAKLNDAFIHKEIDAGSALGVDILQIDAGWQKGRTTGTVDKGGVWDDHWSEDPSFWSANSGRFPTGLLPLSKYAHTRGMKLGLWFAPDSHDDFLNWRKDASRLLVLNRSDDIDAFKLDLVKIRSKKGETNYRSLLDLVQEESSGKLLIDLDVTAETRQGYFGDIAAGPLFVENRYTDWHTYWPHQTLRNFWKLAQYIDPIRLRMEFLNSERNPALYPNDPLAPAQYRPDCLFAMTMFGSPLAFLENSGLSPSYIASAAPVVAAWKRERQAIYRGTTLPIGDAPDGLAWTGFASLTAGGRGGYLLIFRELNAKSVWMLPSSLFPAVDYRIRPLAGNGAVENTNDGFKVSVQDPLGFVWVKLEPTR